VTKDEPIGEFEVKEDYEEVLDIAKQVKVIESEKTSRSKAILYYFR
jgi:hypothetical protein